MTVGPQLLPLRIRLPYTTEEEFIEKYGSNVARGGVFIATRAPKEEGTALAFEFLLADGARLLRGEGVVVKAPAGTGSGQPGMMVRFARLDAPSKALIDRVVARRAPRPAPPGLVRKTQPPIPQAAPPQEPTPAPLPPAPPAPAPAPTPKQPAPAPERPALTPAPPAHAPAPLAPPPAPPAPAPAPPAPAPAPLAPPPAPPAPAPAPLAPPPAPSAPAPAPPAPAPAPLAPEPAPPEPAPPAPAPAPPAPAPAPPEPAPPAPAPPEPAPPAPAPAPPRPAPEPPRPAPEPPAPVPAPAPAPAPVPAPTEEPARAPEPRGRRRTVLEVPVSAPVVPAAPEVVLGIDLGTTQARVAVFHAGALQLVPVGDSGASGLPSALAVDETGQLVVGEAALAYPPAVGLKRLLGLRARSPRLRSFGALPYSVVPDARGDAGLEVEGRVIALTDFAAQLLRELKSAAGSFLGREATRVVLCVPAFFDSRQRAALREAAERAGLTVLRMLNAPAAATLAYGHGRGLARKRVLVVDLGGGGLEVSVVQVTGDDLEVVTTGSDPTLGGMDFDTRIAEALASELKAQGGTTPEQPLDWGLLRAAAESAKVLLSEQEEVPVWLGGDFRPTLTRERVEALTADYVQRVVETTRQVLESGSLTPQGLDAVVLVGGQSRAPLVRRRLEESLGVPVRSDVDPLGAAALGAALLGRSLLEIDSGKPGATVSDVLSMALGVAERGGTLRRIFERNTRLPADKTLVLPVTPGALSLGLFQGTSVLAAENEYLGALHFQLERGGEAEVHFSLSQDGLLSVAATLPGTKKQPVPLATEDLDDTAREALLSRSPFATEAEVRPAGLFSGLRKLFGKR